MSVVEGFGGRVESALKRSEDVVGVVGGSDEGLAEEKGEEVCGYAVWIPVEEVDELATDLEGATPNVAREVAAEDLDVGDDFRAKKRKREALADLGEGEAGGAANVPKRVAGEGCVQGKLGGRTCQRTAAQGRRETTHD